MSKKKIISDFWLPTKAEYSASFNRKDAIKRYLYLAAAKNTISNFVKINCGKSIPVTYHTGDRSFTDGKGIVIGADVADVKNFDVGVGLAFHESGHIIHSDFELCKKISSAEVLDLIPQNVKDKLDYLNIDVGVFSSYLHLFWNYVEDKYIDALFYNTARGYRPYYDKLYDKSFNNPDVIGKALKSEKYRSVSLESYIFRIINMTNKDTDLYALPNLIDIFQIINLSNITRLKNPEDRLNCAIDVFNIILNCIYLDKKQGGNNSNDDSDSDNDQSQNKSDQSSVKNVPSPPKPHSSGNSDVESDFDNDISKKKEEEKNNPDNILGCDDSDADDINDDFEDDMSDDISDYYEDNTDDENLSDKDNKQISSWFDKQKQFLNDDIKKQKINKTDEKMVDVFTNANVTLHTVGSELDSSAPIECVYIKKLTYEYVTSDVCPIRTTQEHCIENNIKLIDIGLRRGKKIARKLLTRRDEFTDIHQYKLRGKLNKKQIHTAEYNDSLFYTDSKYKSKPMNIHLSVDFSTSMSGQKWNDTMILMTSLIQMADILPDFNIVVTARTCDSHIYFIELYDSAVDKISKIKYLFKHIYPNGFTPEGLSFEALLSSLPKTNLREDSTFINISDGEPFISGVNDIEGNHVTYQGIAAAKHTAKIVNKFRQYGWNVISYFINNDDVENITDQYILERYAMLKNLFKTMYGKDAKFINTDSISQVLETLNEKLVLKYLV